MASVPAGSSTSTRDKKKKKSVEPLPYCSVDPTTGVVYRSIEEKQEGEYQTVQVMKESTAIRKQKKKTKGSIGSSSPPKNSSEKKEYVKPTGTGHEASGAGDGGTGKRDDKKDHGGGGGGGGGRRDKKDEEQVYCVKCGFSFFLKDFKDHECKKMHSSIDG